MTKANQNVDYKRSPSMIMKRESVTPGGDEFVAETSKPAAISSAKKI